MQTLFRKVPFAQNFFRLENNVQITKNREPKRNPFSILAILGLVFAVLLFATVSNWENLAPERLEKLLNLFKKFDDNAEQYALVADIDGIYPCPSCPNGGTIWLFRGEVWKYGVSVNGESGRYTVGFLRSNHLHYEMQFKGGLNECYKQEKIKIFTYPTLPENIKRGDKILFRPPGNITD
jgi:hypothetical protein